jgi:PST family polysaccharide transporter
MQQITDTDVRHQAGLARTALQALRWRYGGVAVQLGLQFIIGITLARLLTPRVFGLVGMGLIIVGFGRLIADMGFGAAIIQSPAPITQQHLRAALTGNVVVGLFLFCALWIAAPWLSAVFKTVELTPVLRVIGVSFIPSGANATVGSFFRRQLEFRTVAVVDTISYALAFGMVGVSLALFGYGVWSLVAANILQPLFALVLGLRRTPQCIVRPHFHLQEYRDLIRVASASVLNNVTNYLAENLDSIVTGKWLGVTALGLYNRSFYLATSPVYHFSIGLSSVMFPLYSKIQDDLPRLRQAYLQTISATTMIIMPILFGIAAASGVVIGALFGPQWKPAAGALRILSFAGPLWAIIYASGSVIQARGYLVSEWRRQLIYFLTMTVAIWLLIPAGLNGVALAFALATLTRYLLIAQLTLTLTKISWREFMLAQLPGWLLSAIVFGAVSVTAGVGHLMNLPDLLHLPIIIGVSLVSLAASVLLLPPAWLGNLHPWLSKHFSINVPVLRSST